MSQTLTTPNSFILLRIALAERLKAPLGQFSYWTYVFTGIILLGGLGVWWEVGKYFFFDPDGKATTEGIRLAVITYFPAVGCSAAYQMQLGERNRSYMQSFGSLMGIFFLVCCVLTFLVGLKSPRTSLGMATAFSSLAVLVFWIANAHDKSLQDADPDTPVGGSTATALAGDTAGFKV